MSQLVKQVAFGSTGVKVSPIIVGCMSYGSKDWLPWVEDNKEKVFSVLKYCYDHGLRTFDTADVYSNGTSEKLLGEFLTTYNIPRETVVIMTKIYFEVDESVSLNLSTTDPEIKLRVINQRGLSRKHIMDGVKNSVRRLGTYIDVLQLHRLDTTVPMKEIMRSLNDVVRNGDVRYIGASSMLATEFADLQAIADKHDWVKFSNVQSEYNLIYREDERELFPYAKRHNIAITPWSPNAHGLLTRPISVKSERELAEKRQDSLNEQDKEIINRVEKVAKDNHISMAQTSMAWLFSKGVIPLVGMSSIERVKEAIDSISIKLTDDEISYLEDAYYAKPLNKLYKFQD